MKSLAVNKNIHYRLQFYSFVTFSKLFKKMRPKNPTQLLKKNSAKFKSNNFFEHSTNSDISINHNFFNTKGSFFTCLLPLVLKICWKRGETRTTSQQMPPPASVLNRLSRRRGGIKFFSLLDHHNTFKA